jgi:hypothetical protein
VDDHIRRDLDRHAVLPAARGRLPRRLPFALLLMCDTRLSAC